MPYTPTTARPGLRVQISRDAAGIIRRYGDPDTGQTLTKQEAILRLRVEFESGKIVDSFYNPISLSEVSDVRGLKPRTFINVTQSTNALSAVQTSC